MTARIRCIPAAVLLLLAGCSPAATVRQELAPLSDAIGRLEQRVAALERLQPQQLQEPQGRDTQGIGGRIMEKSKELLEKILPGD